MKTIIIGFLIVVILCWVIYKAIIYYTMDYVHPFPKVNPKQHNMLLISDSIGYGLLSMTSVKKIYRGLLQSYFGSKLVVNGLTVNGATISRNNQRSISHHPNWTEAIEHHYEIIMVQLGTNDSKLDVWVDDDTFKNELTELLVKIQKYNPDARIIFIGPPPIVKVRNKKEYAYTMDASNLESIVKDISKFTQNNNLEFIDLSSLAKDYQSSLFIDGVHPTKKGHKVIADTLIDYISHS